ncbi:hypothetical protein CWATWH0005_2717 [Crocosphaera watsonii WH 0005]|uniref:Uncharacterized protein n=1 Tax=Crocosphaera watsonii WH 0005 TaxID=423472 RepID=T2J1I9_CROWT|nr:hypothetical protein CWATWH0005_2717 [Crocosphaera watsonii WH 0005]
MFQKYFHCYSVFVTDNCSGYGEKVSAKFWQILELDLIPNNLTIDIVYPLFYDIMSSNY